MFGALTKQEVAFFEKVKTGKTHRYKATEIKAKFCRETAERLTESASRAGDITSRLSKDTDLMAKTVCLNVNVMLRTLIKTLGVIYFTLNLSWKLTLLVMMEVPLTGLVQNIYDRHYQVVSGW